MRAMVISSSSLWAARAVTFGLAAASAGSVAFWILQIQSVQVQAPLVSVDTGPRFAINTAAVARALGAPAKSEMQAAPAGNSLSNRLVLAGIVAANKGSGAALISVDGKTAKSFQVGTTVVDNWVLRRVQPRSVSLSQGGADVVLELPVKASGSAPLNAAVSVAGPAALPNRSPAQDAVTR